MIDQQGLHGLSTSLSETFFFSAAIFFFLIEFLYFIFLCRLKNILPSSVTGEVFFKKVIPYSTCQLQNNMIKHGCLTALKVGSVFYLYFMLFFLCMCVLLLLDSSYKQSQVSIVLR